MGIKYVQLQALLSFKLCSLCVFPLVLLSPPAELCNLFRCGAGVFWAAYLFISFKVFGLVLLPLMFPISDFWFSVSYFLGPLCSSDLCLIVLILARSFGNYVFVVGCIWSRTSGFCF